jgi:phage terminase large subunit GpA-like protein
MESGKNQMTQLLQLTQPDPVEWCERNVQLDYGQFDRAKHPLIVEPLRAGAKMRGGTVGILGSVQHIKTLAAQLLQLYRAQTAPTRQAHYDLTKDTIKEFSEDKFQPLLKNTKAVMDCVPDDRKAQTTFYTQMAYGFIRLCSAGILAHRNSKTFEFVSADESWAYDASWIKQIKDRTTSYTWSWSMFLPTSGQTAASELDDMWNESTQRTWHIKCDCCGEEIPYVWNPDSEVGGMKFASGEEARDADGGINYDNIRASVEYECQLCGGRMPWNPADVARRNLAGRYVQMNPHADPKIDFYHYNAIAHHPWPDLAVMWYQALAAKQRGSLDDLENFIRKRLCQPWDETKYIAVSNDVESAGDYELDTPWPDALHYICTIDWQKDHWYVVIRAWACNAESRLIHAAKVTTNDNAIVDLCNKWGIAQGGIDPQGGGCQVLVDGNYNTAEVQRVAAKNGWLVLRGENCKPFRHDDGTFKIYGDMQMIDTWQGTDIKTGAVKYCGQFRYSVPETRLRLATLRSMDEPKQI